VDGRAFTAEEISESRQVMVVSESFASINKLSVGSILSLEQLLFDYAEFQVQMVGNFMASWHLPEFWLAQRTLDFEIVGIFEVVLGESEEEYLESLIRGAGFVNQFYVPIGVVEGMLSFAMSAVEAQPRYRQDMLLPGANSQLMQSGGWGHALFLLHDPRDLGAFQTAGTELLPGNWRINDVRGAHQGITGAMDNLLQMADMILATTIGATAVILTLLIILLIHERKGEIGIYMALGEQKVKILAQFFLEIFGGATVAIGLALFAGNYLSGLLTDAMLEQHLMGGVAEHDAMHLPSAVPWELSVFDPGEIPLDDVMAMYDTSLTGEMMLWFIGASGLVILVSTILPVIQIVRVNPKKILM